CSRKRALVFSTMSAPIASQAGLKLSGRSSLTSCLSAPCSSELSTVSLREIPLNSIVLQRVAIEDAAGRLHLWRAGRCGGCGAQNVAQGNVAGRNLGEPGKRVGIVAVDALAAPVLPEKIARDRSGL